MGLLKYRIESTIMKNSKTLNCLLFALILTPSFRIMSSIPAVRFDDMIAFFFIITILSSKRIPWSLQNTLLLFFTFCILLSIFVGSYMGYDTSFGDFNQITRIVKYLAVISIVLKYLRDNNYSVAAKIHTLKVIVLLGSVLSLITFQQYFDFLKLNELYVEYVAPTQYQTLINGYPWPRPVGMVGNPNELSYLLAISAILPVYLMFFHRQSILWSVLSVINIASTFLTLSRTGVIFLVISLFFILFWAVVDKRINTSAFVFIIFVVILGFVLIDNTTLNDKIFWRFSEGVDLSTSESWVQRINNWGENYNIFKTSPIFGVGPLRSVQFEFAADNEWLLILRSYGILGCIYFVLMFLIPIIVSLVKVDREHRSFLRLYLSVILGSVIYMIPAVIFHSLTLMPVLLIVATLSLNGSREVTKRVRDIDVELS